MMEQSLRQRQRLSTTSTVHMNISNFGTSSCTVANCPVCRINDATPIVLTQSQRNSGLIVNWCIAGALFVGAIWAFITFAWPYITAEFYYIVNAVSAAFN